jgi:hypothetical protein
VISLSEALVLSALVAAQPEIPSTETVAKATVASNLFDVFLLNSNLNLFSYLGISYIFFVIFDATLKLPASIPFRSAKAKLND